MLNPKEVDVHDNRDSLAFGVPPAPVGTIHALSIDTAFTAGPDEGSRVVFGRNWSEVDVCVGGHDQGVSRRHGEFVRRGARWWLRNLGRRPMRLPGSQMLFKGQEPLPLGTGYTPLFVHGRAAHEHLLELYVTGSDEPTTVPGHTAPTDPPRTWALDPVERLVLVVLAQRYLLQEHYPQPVAWQQAAVHLVDLQPEAKWNDRKVERLVGKIRMRLSAAGVAGLTREEVGEPVGNTLNHNLIRELIESTTLVPPDLILLDHPDD